MRYKVLLIMTILVFALLTMILIRDVKEANDPAQQAIAHSYDSLPSYYDEWRAAKICD